MPELTCARCNGPAKGKGRKPTFCQPCSVSLAARKRPLPWKLHASDHTVRASQARHQTVKAAPVTLPGLAFAQERPR
jgi:hypothetical protein